MKAAIIVSKTREINTAKEVLAYLCKQSSVLGSDTLGNSVQCAKGKTEMGQIGSEEEMAHCLAFFKCCNNYSVMGASHIFK